MVGSRKLSNDEVEALLSGLDEESKEETAQQFDPNEVREFKFGTEDLSLLGDYYALRMINEKICRFTRSVFLPMLRIMPRISSFPPEVKSFDEYVESCDNFVSVTNSRIEDLREAAKILEGRKVAEGVEAIVVPGSAMTRLKAESEGLRTIFETAGFEWRPEAGCSMCLAMNDDIAMEGERVASSTNRNFEGRQGRGARTHLMSPAMVAAAAVCGHLADIRDFE